MKYFFYTIERLSSEKRLAFNLGQAFADSVSRLEVSPEFERWVKNLAYYALVHEIAALPDFGRLPVPPWLIERRNRLGQLLQQGARLAMMSVQVDLLAELLLCAQILGLPVSGDLRAGVDFLVASQRVDGTWGQQATTRSNRIRHAVMTATAALLAYSNTATEQ